MNRVCLIGRLTKDIEVRATMSGKKVTSFTLAVNRTKDLTDWVPCVAWEKTVDILQSYTHKGSQIAVEGSIQTSSYDDPNRPGTKVFKCEVLVDRIQLLDKREETQTTQVPVPQVIEVEDTDLPF